MCPLEIQAAHLTIRYSCLRFPLSQTHSAQSLLDFVSIGRIDLGEDMAKMFQEKGYIDKNSG